MVLLFAFIIFKWSFGTSASNAYIMNEDGGTVTKTGFSWKGALADSTRALTDAGKNDNSSVYFDCCFFLKHLECEDIVTRLMPMGTEELQKAERVA